MALAITACSRGGPPADVIEDKKPSPYHIVARGESVSLIAKRYGMSKDELVRLNQMKPPYQIFVGQKLIIIPKTYGKSSPITAFEEKDQKSSIISSPEDVQVQVLDQPPGKTPTETQEATSTGAALKSPNEEIASEPTGVTQQPHPEQASKIKKGDNEALKQVKKIGSLSFQWPVQGKIQKSFSKKPGAVHPGINIIAPLNTKVVAAESGKVVHADFLKAYGNTVVVQHTGTNVMSIYAHLGKVNVKPQTSIKKGGLIGAVGKTGKAKETTLHFEIREGTTPVDPLEYLP
ncbi:MAG: M23 family metallopeptidase [Proteobacteria bacterium]|nr:M23 family metallopeptidase [Pseudomonadota bacterium]